MKTRDFPRGFRGFHGPETLTYTYKYMSVPGKAGNSENFKFVRQMFLLRRQMLGINTQEEDSLLNLVPKSTKKVSLIL